MLVDGADEAKLVTQLNKRNRFHEKAPPSKPGRGKGMG